MQQHDLQRQPLDRADHPQLQVTQRVKQRLLAVGQHAVPPVKVPEPVARLSTLQRDLMPDADRVVNLQQILTGIDPAVKHRPPDRRLDRKKDDRQQRKLPAFGRSGRRLVSHG